MKLRRSAAWIVASEPKRVVMAESVTDRKRDTAGQFSLQAFELDHGTEGVSTAAEVEFLAESGGRDLSIEGRA